MFAVIDFIANKLNIDQIREEWGRQFLDRSWEVTYSPERLRQLGTDCLPEISCMATDQH